MLHLAKIQTIKDGEFYVKVNDTLIKLYEGDTINLNDTIVSAKSNVVSVQIVVLLDTHDIVTINSQGEIKLDTSLFNDTFENEELAFNSDAINDGFSAWANAKVDIKLLTQEEKNSIVEENIITEDDSIISDSETLTEKFLQRDNRQTHVSANYDGQSALNFNRIFTSFNDDKILADLLNRKNFDSSKTLINTQNIPQIILSSPPPPGKFTMFRGLISKDENGIVIKDKILDDITPKVDKPTTLSFVQKLDEDLDTTIKNTQIREEQAITEDKVLGEFAAKLDKPVSLGFVQKLDEDFKVDVEISRTVDTYQQDDIPKVTPIAKVLNPNMQAVKPIELGVIDKKVAIKQEQDVIDKNVQTEKEQDIILKAENTELKLDNPVALGLVQEIDKDLKVGIEILKTDDIYKQEDTQETISITKVSNSNAEQINSKADIIISGDKLDSKITTKVTSNQETIDTNTNLSKLKSVKIYAENSYGNGYKSSISIFENKGYHQRGFGITTTDPSGKIVKTVTGDAKEITNKEKLVVEFDNPTDSVDIALGWRAPYETAKLIFKEGGKNIGYAKVSGGAMPKTVDFTRIIDSHKTGAERESTIEYFDSNNHKIKTEHSAYRLDQHDLLHKFEFPKLNGKERIFDKVEITGFDKDDDFLLDVIKYHQNIAEFNIQVDKKYALKGEVVAIMKVEEKEYKVPIDTNGHGKLKVPVKNLDNDLSKVNIKYVEMKDTENENLIINKSEDFDDIKANNLSLSLKDVLKIKGDEHSIKISGDTFDKVTFKNDVGKDGKGTWIKISGNDGYDIYINDADPTLKVKVEQIISDGITN